jgi:hypothetical protein
LNGNFNDWKDKASNCWSKENHYCVVDISNGTRAVVADYEAKDITQASEYII